MSKRTADPVIKDAEDPKRPVPAIQKPLNMMEWIENNKDSFAPPVCNKLMYGAGQLKIMFVGGPNTRKDFHIEEGEELFFQIQGDMLLKVLEKGKPKEILIKEGEIFCLPSRIHHSPQRFGNTIGLVIERERVANEYDGIRYFCEDSVSVLWEKWFHCEDLGTQLNPVFKEYFASEPHKTGKPDPSNIRDEPPLKVDTETELQPPFSLNQWLQDNKDDYKTSSKALFDQGETKVIVHGAGEQTGTSKRETWLWQKEGKSSVVVGDVTRQMEKNSVVIIPTGSDNNYVIVPGRTIFVKSVTKGYKITGEENSVVISVTMDPDANK